MLDRFGRHWCTSFADGPYPVPALSGPDECAEGEVAGPHTGDCNSRNGGEDDQGEVQGA